MVGAERSETTKNQSKPISCFTSFYPPFIKVTSSIKMTSFRFIIGSSREATNNLLKISVHPF